MPTGRRLTDEDKRRMVNLFREGTSINKIAETMGIAWQTVKKHLEDVMAAEVRATGKDAGKAPVDKQGRVLRLPSTDPDPETSLDELLRQIQSRSAVPIYMLVGDQPMDTWMSEQKAHGNLVRAQLTTQDIRLVWNDSTVEVLMPASVRWDPEGANLVIEFTPNLR